jgi:hypothetical protein
MDQLKRIIVLVVALLACGGVIEAQEKQAPAAAAVPVLSELDRLKLDNVILKIENTQAQMQAAQQVLLKLQDDAKALAAALQKPGYQLTRAQDGSWSYVVAPPDPKPIEKPKP